MAYHAFPSPTLPAKKKKAFKRYEVGYVHVDITEFTFQKKKYYIYVAMVSDIKQHSLIDLKLMDKLNALIEP